MSFRDLITRGRSDVPASREQDPFLALQSRINELFDGFFGRSTLTPFRGLPSVWSEGAPRVDVTEDVEEIRLEAELPGVDDEDIDVSLVENALIIRGEKKTEREQKEGEDRVYAERAFGSFQRTIPLPCEVIADQVEATFKKGVLTVRMPKSKEAKERTRRIPVKSKD